MGQVVEFVRDERPYIDVREAGGVELFVEDLGMERRMHGITGVGKAEAEQIDCPQAPARPIARRAGVKWRRAAHGSGDKFALVADKSMLASCVADEMLTHIDEIHVLQPRLELGRRVLAEDLPC